MNLIWSVQYLRAIAALSVVVFHTLESSTLKFSIGAAGVDVFFVISGFIMASLMLGAEAAPAKFLWRRVVRIVPLYWIATLGALAIAWIKPNFFLHFDSSLENVLFSLAFVPHVSATNGVTPVLWQGWTLEYEMFFYALCTIALALPMRNHRLKLLGGVLAALVFLGLAAPSDNPIMAVYTNPLLLEFAAGAALGAAWCGRKLPGPRVGAALLLAGVGCYALQQAGFLALSGARAFDWGVPAAMIVAGALGLELHGRVPHSHIGRLLGDASYSIYLTHGFFVGGFLWYFSDAPLWVRVPVCIAGSIAVALVSYRWVERPITNALKSIRLPGAASWASRW